MGFSRQEYWIGLPCLLPGDLFNPGIEPTSPVSLADSWPTEPPGKPPVIWYLVTKELAWLPFPTSTTFFPLSHPYLQAPLVGRKRTALIFLDLAKKKKSALGCALSHLLTLHNPDCSCLRCRKSDKSYSHDCCSWAQDRLSISSKPPVFLFFFVQRRTFVFSQVSSDCCSKHSRLLPTAPHPLHLGGEHRRMPSHPLGAIHCTLAGLQGWG